MACPGETPLVLILVKFFSENHLSRRNTPSFELKMTCPGEEGPQLGKNFLCPGETPLVLISENDI